MIFPSNRVRIMVATKPVDSRGGTKASLGAPFANGVEKAIAAVRDAITSSWANGQTESQITKNLIKRRPRQD